MLRNSIPRAQSLPDKVAHEYMKKLKNEGYPGWR